MLHSSISIYTVENVCYDIVCVSLDDTSIIIIHYDNTELLPMQPFMTKLYEMFLCNTELSVMHHTSFS